MNPITLAHTGDFPNKFEKIFAAGILVIQWHGGLTINKKKPQMNLVFRTSVVFDGFKLDYEVFEFKLHPGKYKAELIEGEGLFKQIIFSKGKTKWRAVNNDTKYLAELIGEKIDHFKRNVSSIESF